MAPSASSDDPIQPQLAAALGELRLELPKPQQLRLLALARLLSTWAQRMNLTAHRTPETALSRLILDAVALSTVLPDAAGVADLGSGAGFPGLPLAVLRPHSRLLLVESRLRRHHFQRAALRDLGLDNVRLLLGRIEEVPAEPQPLVIAQALAPPQTALEWMLPWCAPGGALALPLGASPPRFDPPAGVVARGLRRYRVPGGPERTLWVGSRE